MKFPPFLRASLAFAALSGAIAAHAVELIANGGFENGLTGWTSVSSLAANGGYDPSSPGTSARAYGAQGSSGAAPLSGLGVLSPSVGNAYALADATGAGATALLQNFTVPTGTTSLTLSYRMYVYDYYGYGPQGAGLTYSGSPGSAQLARVDLLRGTSADFSTAAADVVRSFYAGSPSDPNAAFALSTFDLTGLAAGSYRLRFSTVDNGFVVSQGIDAVTVNAVPEPAAFLSFALGALSFLRRRVRRA